MADRYGGFRFDLGSHLQTKNPDGWKPSKPLWQKGDGRARLFVVERTYQECPGGIQLHYVCRVIDIDGSMSTTYLQFNEIEVEPWEPPNNQG